MFNRSFFRLVDRSLHFLRTRKIIDPFEIQVSLHTKKYPYLKQTETDKLKESQIDFSGFDSDDFGNLSEHCKDSTSRGILQQPLKSENIQDDSDGYDKLEIKRGVKKSIDAYNRILSEMWRQKPPDVAQMLELHRQFVYEDRYIPERTLYSLLIEACAKVGYTKKAIELYDEMRMFQLKPTKSTVTSLFNACANCSHTKEYGLQQVFYLRDKFQLNGYEFNDIQYNVIIKAFSRLGDMSNAYSTMEEMVNKGHSVSLDTYSMLLMGCISDSKNGLFDATKIVSKLLQNGSNIHVSIMNLFLRCIRDCQIERENLHQIYLSQSATTNVLSGNKVKQFPISHSEIMAQSKEGNSLSTVVLPNLLTGTNLNQIISIDYDSLSRASDRFLLFGGLDGFTKLIDSYSIKPNLKTITLLIDLMNSKDCFPQVKLILKKYNLKADVYLYNVLIKKASKSRNYPLCQEIIGTMQNEFIQPDIMTFGALTFCCTQANYAKKLLHDMSKCGIIVNDKIIGSLINIACSREDLNYVSFLLDYIEQNNLQLSRIDVEQIDLFLKKINREIATNERQNISVNFDYKKGYANVSYKFKTLLKSSKIELNTDPWRQFDLNPNANKKAKFNSYVKFMKQKSHIKMGTDKSQVTDYNDEIE